MAFRSADHLHSAGGLKRLAVGLVVLVSASATAGRPASAHAVVDAITPADGSVLGTSPEEAIIDFSEPVLADLADVSIVTSAGDLVAPGAVTLDAVDESILHVELPELGHGTFEVTITTRDRADLHEVVARTAFGVGVEAPAPSQPVRTPPLPLEALARWVFAFGLVLLYGVVAVGMRWPDVPITRPATMRHVAAWGIGIALLGRLGVIGARALDLPDGADVWSTIAGTGDMRRLPFVVLALAALVPLARERVPIWLDAAVRESGRTTVRQFLAIVGLVWLTVLAAWGDHSALTGRVEPDVAVAKAMHLGGLGLWLGVIVVAWLANRGSASIRSAWWAVSGLALTGASIAIASGLLLTGRLVVSVTALLSTGYGLALIVKVVVVLGAIAVGWRSRRRDQHPSPRRVELALLAAAAAVGATLATSGPPIERSFLPAAEAAPAPESRGLADDVLVQVQALPGRPGPNTVQVRVTDTRRPAPATFDAVEVMVDGRVAGSARVVEGVAFVDEVELGNGATPIDVVVRREAWEQSTVRLEVATQPAAYRAPVRISSAPIGGAVAGAGWSLVGVCTLAGLRHRRRRRHSTSETGVRPLEVGTEETWTDVAPPSQQA